MLARWTLILLVLFLAMPMTAEQPAAINKPGSCLDHYGDPLPLLYCKRSVIEGVNRRPVLFA